MQAPRRNSDGKRKKKNACMRICAFIKNSRFCAFTRIMRDVIIMRDIVIILCLT